MSERLKKKWLTYSSLEMQKMFNKHRNPHLSKKTSNYLAMRSTIEKWKESRQKVKNLVLASLRAAVVIEVVFHRMIKRKAKKLSNLKPLSRKKRLKMVRKSLLKTKEAKQMMAR